MDYAFAPGTTGYDNIMKDLFRQRANTSLIDRAAITQVDQFIRHLATGAGVTRPVGDMLVASHGNDNGWMEIQLANIDADGDGVTDANITYEVLEIADSTNVIDLPTAIRDINTKFHIKGCKIGQSLPFVQKLKAALGNAVPVTAPKFFHEVWFRTDLGVLEYLGYDFSVVRPTAFASRAALLAAFQGAGLQWIDNSAVPNENWANWIPTNVSIGRRARSYTVNLNPSLTPTSGSPVSSLRLPIHNGFRHDAETFTFTINYSGHAPPTGTAARKAAMKTIMAGGADFQTTHAYPIYKRYEYNSLDEFVDGFVWVFNYDASHTRMTCVGTRHRYTVVVPITNPTDNNLYFNFYPYAGNTTPVINQLLETDARFFLTV